MDSQSSQVKAPETRLSTVTAASVNGGKFSPNPLLPRLGQLGSPMLPIYPSISTSEDQPTQFKSRFLAKHQKERSPLSPDRSVASTRYSRNPFIAKASLSSLRENEESSSPLMRSRQNGNDRLTNQIQSFINRTDHVSNDWKNLGQQRALSVGPAGDDAFRDERDMSLRLPLPAPQRNAMRASSVAPNVGFVQNVGTSRFGADSYGDNTITERLNPNQGLKRRNTDPNRHKREFASPVRSPPRDLEYSFRNTPSINPSVASRAKRAPGYFTNGGPSVASNNLRPNGGRFMSLEDECNWILSGREPLPNDLNGYCDPDDDSGADDNTLDDISGDEVNGVLMGINNTWKLSIIYILASLYSVFKT